MLAVLAFAIAACAETLDQTIGVVIGVESPGFGQVDAFELVTPDGERLTFDTTEFVFQPEFPASHMGEHQRLSEPIEVTYRQDGDRLIITRLRDGG